MPRRAEIELINEVNYFVFQPLLPEVAAGSVSIRDAVAPLRRLLLGVRVRKIDPDLAEIYWRLMTTRGHHQKLALCAVANRLANRIYSVMRSGKPLRAPRRRGPSDLGRRGKGDGRRTLHRARGHPRFPANRLAAPA